MRGPQGHERQHSGCAAAVTLVMNVFRRAIVGASVRLLPRRVVNGMEVVFFSGAGDPDMHLDKVAAALDLVRQCSPRRFARIRRDITRIAVVGRGGEVYDHALRTYMVDLEVLQHRSTEEAALAIVHEATHARLWNCNIKTTERNEARIESLCVKQEIEFAARLTNAATLIERARAKLSQPWWGAAPQERRMEDQLLSLRVQKWIIAVLRAIRRHFADSPTK